MAEGARFELAGPFGPPVFKTGVFNRSTTPPLSNVRLEKAARTSSSRKKRERQRVDATNHWRLARLVGALYSASMNRPLVGLAIAFCAGIALGEWMGLPLTLLWLVFASAWVVAVALVRHRFGNMAMHTAVLMGGLLGHGLANSYPQPHHLLRLISDRAQNVTSRAVITQEPVRTFYKRPRGEQEREYFFARVEAIDRGDDWEHAAGDIVVWLDQPPRDDQLRYGDRIEFNALLRRPLPPTNPGIFDYRTYLERHGLFYEARIHDAADVKLLGHEKQRVMDCGMWLQRRFLESTARGLETTRIGDEPVIVGLLRAMLVGFRPGLTNELAEPFMRTGTLHVFAVSGLHVAVIAGILVGVLRFLRLDRRGCALVALPLLLVYTIATGAPASAVRSFLMAATVLIAWALPRPTDLLNSIAAAAIIILVRDPMQLFDPGFQLSFVVVIAIALMVPGQDTLVAMLYRRPKNDPSAATVLCRLPGRLADWLVCDPYLPAKVLPHWRQRWYGAVRLVAASLAVSLAACLGSIPLIAHYFHLFTSINFLSNMIIVPLSSLTITIGFASLLVDMLWSPLAACLNNVNYLLMKLMLATSYWFECWPKAFVYVQSPPLWLSAAYYVSLGLFIYASARGLVRRFQWAGVAVLCALAIGLAARNGEQTVTLTALSVGEGNALFVDLPGERHDTLIDCGPARTAQFVLQPFLRAQGCDDIETLILTHADVNHAGAIHAVLNGFHPRRIFDNGQSRWTRPSSEPLPGYPCQRLVAGASLPLGEGVELRVLHPSAGRMSRIFDDNSLVLQLRCGTHRVLLVADIGASVERQLVAVKADLRSDVLIKGLHNRESSCTDDFLDAVAPQWVVISCSGVRYEAAILDPMLKRIREHGAKALLTGMHGAVTIQLQPDELTVKSFLPDSGAVLSSAPDEKM